MSIPQLTFICAALAAASYSSSGAGILRSALQKEAPSQEVRRLTNQEKLQRMMKIPTGVNQSPKAVFDSFRLTVNDPVIKDKAAVTFHNFALVCPRSGYVGYAKSIDDKVGAPTLQFHPYVSLIFNVSQPNKTHVATFYFYCFGWMPAEFYIDGKLVQEIKYENGAVQAMVAFKPTKKGTVKIDLKADEGFAVRMNFTAVDMDLVQ